MAGGAVVSIAAAVVDAITLIYFGAPNHDMTN